MPEEDTSFETPLSEEQAEIVRERDYNLRLKHGALPQSSHDSAPDLETYR